MVIYTLLYKLSERPGRWPCLHGQLAGHSEANRYEHEVTCEARHGNANTGEGFESAESAKKPASYIHCGTVCSMYVYYISFFKQAGASCRHAKPGAKQNPADAQNICGTKKLFRGTTRHSGFLYAFFDYAYQQKAEFLHFIRFFRKTFPTHGNCAHAPKVLPYASSRCGALQPRARALLNGTSKGKGSFIFTFSVKFQVPENPFKTFRQVLYIRKF